MREPTALAVLFPTIRGDVLTATPVQTEKLWFPSEFEQSPGTWPLSLRRALKTLVDWQR
jgi:hypothetical protein